MRIRYTIDVAALERTLLDRITGRPHGGLDEPLLVLVPTRRLAEHLARRVLATRPAVLATQILTPRRLSVAALELALEPAPRVLPATAHSALARGILADLDSDDARWTKTREGALAALTAALRDLRDAGVSPEELARAGAAPLLASVYPRYADGLEQLAAGGLTDTLGLVRAALPHLAGFLERKGIRHVIQHGAYELIGAHVELLRAIDDASGVDLEVLLPGELERPALASPLRCVDALRRDRRDAACEALPTEPGSRERAVERFASLFDHAARFEEPLGAPALEIRSSQGEREELRHAALRAAAMWRRDGIPLGEIAIVARTLEPWEPLLDATMRELGVPYVTSAAPRATRLHGVRGFLALARVVEGGFERAAVIALLRSHRLRIAGLAAGALPVEAWDRASRRRRVVAGIDAWRALGERTRRDDDAESDDETGSETPRVDELIAGLEALEALRARWKDALTVADHVAVLRETAALLDLEDATDGDETGRGDGPRAPTADGLASRRAIDDALDELELTARCAASAGLPSEMLDSRAMRERLEAALGGTRLRQPSAEARGVRVLDLMEARGLTFRAVIWIGFHDGVFPRRSRPDVTLSDELRTRLTEATGRVLYPKSEGAREERLLLGMTLASARERVVISYQRAGDDGARRGRSSALREVARAFIGRPDAAALQKDDTPGVDFERISAHPGERGRELARSARLGLCDEPSAIAACALHGESGLESTRTFLRSATIDVPGAAAALAAIERIDAFDLSGKDALAFDGVTGLPAAPESYRSPSAIETLARCPLQFFQKHVLRLRALDPEPRAERIEVRQFGSAAHDALQALYADLVADPLWSSEPRDAEALAARAVELLEMHWRAELRRAVGPSYDALPALFGAVDERWLGTLRGLVEEDVRELCVKGARQLELERSRAVDVDFGEGVVVKLVGRLDRVVRFEKDVWLDDYKTGKGKYLVSPAEILRARVPQLPLYVEMLAASGTPRASIDASYRLLDPDLEPDKRRARREKLEDLREGFLETVRELVALARAGRFPAHDKSDRCKLCDFRRGCRYQLRPTEHRFGQAAAFAAFRDVQRKKQKLETLADVRREASAEKGSAEDENGTTPRRKKSAKRPAKGSKKKPAKRRTRGEGGGA